MQFNFKNYQTKKTKIYLKNKSLLLLTIGANQNSQNWINMERNLYKIKFLYYKTYNNTTKKVFLNSIYKNFKHTISSTFFFLEQKQKTKTIKNNAIDILNYTLFSILAIKLNKKMYSAKELKNIYSLNFKKNVLVMQQFLITNLKRFTHP